MKSIQGEDFSAGKPTGFIVVAMLGLTGLVLRLWLKQKHAVSPRQSAAVSAGVPRAPEGTAPQAPGYEAEWPTEIPPRGWWQIAKRVFGEISNDRILAEAAGVTFYVLLAIFPALATLVSIYGLVADPKTISDQLTAISGVLPEGGMKILRDQINALISKPSGGLGLGALIGLLTSIWSANAGMKALFDALNVVYDEKEQRSFVRRTLLTLGFTMGALVFLMLAVSGVVVLPAVLGFLGLGNMANILLSLLRWPLLLVILSLFLALVYRYGPSQNQHPWRWVSTGGAGATLLWLTVSFAFSYYVQNFGSYNKTYGSLGAVVGFLTWIWLSTSVILIGAELDSEMERQASPNAKAEPAA